MSNSYTINEAAAALRVSRGQLYAEIGAGRLKTYTIGRRRFISSEALAAFIHAREEVEAQRHQVSAQP